MDISKTITSLICVVLIAASCGGPPPEQVTASGDDANAPRSEGEAPTDGKTPSDGDAVDGETVDDFPNDEEPEPLLVDDDVTESPATEVKTTTSRDDLIDPKPVVVYDLTTVDGSTVTALFSGGHEPCSGAKATVFDEGDVVEVLIEMGATPEAISATCPDSLVDYEMEIPLTTALADRALEIHIDSRADSEDGAILVSSRDDLENLRAIAIDELAVTDDGTAVKIWFTGGLEECYGSKGTLVETDEVVEVLLEVGTPPESTGACNDIGVYSVMKVQLSAPLGDRSLVAHPESDPNIPPGSSGGQEVGDYVGLSLEEAEMRAADSGFAFRVFWVDGEDLVVTQDYNEGRMNVAIENGVVVEFYVG